jgi:hypothetical protein
MFTTVIKNFADDLRPPTREAIEQERREQMQTVKDIRRMLLGTEGLRIPAMIARVN